MIIQPNCVTSELGPSQEVCRPLPRKSLHSHEDQNLRNSNIHRDKITALTNEDNARMGWSHNYCPEEELI